MTPATALLETASAPVLHESDLVTETGLPAREIHGRLVVLSRAQHRVESALAFYLLEVERRALFVELRRCSRLYSIPAYFRTNKERISPSEYSFAAT